MEIVVNFPADAALTCGKSVVFPCVRLRLAALATTRAIHIFNGELLLLLSGSRARQGATQGGVQVPTGGDGRWSCGPRHKPASASSEGQQNRCESGADGNSPDERVSCWQRTRVSCLAARPDAVYQTTEFGLCISFLPTPLLSPLPSPPHRLYLPRRMPPPHFWPDLPSSAYRRRLTPCAPERAAGP